MEFKLRLVVENIANLPLESHDCNMIAKVEWRGSERKAGFLARRFENNYTYQHKVKANGTVSWNEGFHHTCKFMRKRSGIYKSWIIVLQIMEVQEKARKKMKTIGKVNVDVTEFIQLENDKSIRIPINCSIGGHTTQVILMVKPQLIKVESKDRNRITLTRDLSRKTKSFKLSHNQSRNLPKCDNESEVQFRKLTEPNLFILNETSNCHDIEKLTETCIQEPSSKPIGQKQRSFARLLCLSTERDSPLQAKEEDEPHYNPCVPFISVFKKVKVRPEENFKTFGFERNHKFQVGQWMRKKLMSRDDKIELVTDVFLASIDQRSKRAAGGSACTVLAAVVADWLHKNPKSLPSHCQFDELVLKGSLEWRNLCDEGNHKVMFSDKHFDLDTVLKAKIKSLTVATEKSYVGFFSMDEMHDGFDWLQGEMSFDNIWNNILCNEGTDERIYIISWNDHFFVLKVESDAIYLLDTLGERLSEGCNHAYILKFDAESVIYRHSEDGQKSKKPQDLVSEGIECCKEYIKGFLSAIPLREVLKDIKRGQAKQELLNRLLQIDFHYTSPCMRKNC